MGRGPREENDPPMKPPIDLTSDTEGDPQLGGEGQEDSYCATQREVGFAIEESADLEVGESITLRIGDPVEVVRGEEAIGRLGNRESQSMKSCITMGYAMTGAVASLEPALKQGTLRISGARRED